MEIHILDRRLRLLVMDAIERIEVSLRGGWAHHVAMKYGPHSYLDPGLYHRADRYAQAFLKLIEDLRRSKDTFILHYKNRYDDPEHSPVWMTAEVISLGQFSMWYSNLKNRFDPPITCKVADVFE
ncbi:Abi family protein [Rhizobium sp. B230/85]|nr:Abi family protein [Rhizobium sp. B209b/85]QXZ98444.1 Abi family protein [Rhizobium sp. B230/85]